MEDSKALFDYWYERVQLRNYELIEAPGHVKTYELRHECSNYDDLRLSREVKVLEEPERSKVIAIIKYECTAKVLQYRAGCFRERANKFEDACNELDKQKSKLLSLIKALQEKLFGKDQEFKKLEARIAVLEAENEALRAEAENDKAYAKLLAKFEQLKKQYETVEKRRRELAKNNQSLGGRVAHAQRFKQERDEARALAEEQKQLAEEQKQQAMTLTEENQHLREENERLGSELAKLQKQNKLGIVEIRKQ